MEEETWWRGNGEDSVAERDTQGNKSELSNIQQGLVRIYTVVVRCWKFSMASSARGCLSLFSQLSGPNKKAWLAFYMYLYSATKAS